MGMAAEQQVLQQRRVLEQLDVLEGARNADARDIVGRHLGDVAPLEDQLAFGRIVDPADQVEDRGLACPVRPDDGEDLALSDVEGDAVDRLDTTEVDGEILSPKQRRHRLRSDLV